jgi:uncharacterized protein (DUF1501 family)
MGEAAAQNASTDDYKALVCIFLYGGNDHDNTFVPYDNSSHSVYKTLRDIGEADSNIYVPQNKLTPLVPINNLASGRQYAVQAAMGQMANLFNDDRKMGVLLNVGPLVKPTNKTSYTSATTGDLSVATLTVTCGAAGAGAACKPMACAYITLMAPCWLSCTHQKSLPT